MNPLIGAVIQGINEVREEDFDDTGETWIYTSAGKIIINGTISRIGEVSE